MEPEPEPHYFDAYPSPTHVPPLLQKGSALKANEPLVDKGSAIKEKRSRQTLPPSGDTEQLPGKLPPFVPLKPKEDYSGLSQLRFIDFHQGIDTRIPYYPMKGKKEYLSVEYPSEYATPEQTTTVEHPTHRKKTEPVQDVVPRVKGKKWHIPSISKFNKLHGQ